MTGHKIDLRSGVIVGSLQLCAALKAYANATNDKVLLAKVDYVKSDFTQVADSVVFDIATLLLFLASPLLPLLEKYFVDVQIISEFNAELNRFHDSLPQKRVATAGTKVATENIGQVFDTLTNLLNDEIDVLIDLFKEREPRFFMEYTNARIIVNYGEGASLKTPLPVVPIAEPK